VFAGAIDRAALATPFYGLPWRAIAAAAAAVTMLGVFAVVRTATSPRRAAVPAPTYHPPVVPLPVVPPPVALPPTAPPPPELPPPEPPPPEPPPSVGPRLIEVEPPPEAPRPTGTRVRPGLARAQGRAMLKSAQTLLKAQRYEEAEEAFKRVLGGRRERGMALVGLGNIAFQKQNYAEAETRAREARTANGGIEAALLLGDAYFKQGKYADAKAAYDDALHMDGGSETAKKRARAGSDLAARRM
jgi:hypothetical protein